MNSNGDTVAWYALGVPGEVYESSSGRAFGVEELYLHLTVGKQALRASPFELGLITNRWQCVRIPRYAAHHAIYCDPGHVKVFSARSKSNFFSFLVIRL